MASLLLLSLVTFAQAKKDSKTDFSKLSIRLRGIAAIPPSTSYDLSGSDVKISTSVVPELDFTYYFTKNLAAELILGTTHHKVTLENGSAKTNLGKVWLLPPTLNVQYHLPVGGFIPYVGAGINYTIFYGVKDDAVKLDYQNNVGFSTQLGFDYMLNKKFFINLDVKKIFLKSDVTIKGAVPTVLNNVKIDPWVVGLGVGVKL